MRGDGRMNFAARATVEIEAAVRKVGETAKRLIAEMDDETE